MDKNNNRINFRNIKGIVGCFIALCVLLIALFIRLAYIQLINDDFYRDEASSQQTNDVTVSAKRGNILDRNGTVLATSVTSYTLSCKSQELLEKKELDVISKMAEDISKITYQTTEEVYSKLVSNEEEAKISDYLSLTQVNQLKELDYYGLKYKSTYSRYYPFNDFASQLLGSMTVDNTGRSGLEAEYDHYLSGIDGRWVKLTDVNGDELEGSDSSYYEAQNGLNVVTTIDATIQYYAEEAIKKAMDSCNPKRVMCLVTNPNTGEILASAVTDGFDCNHPYVPTNDEQKVALEEMTEREMVDFVSWLWRNPIVNDAYELGSIFKPLIASMVIEDKAMSLDETMYCSGELVIGDDVISCSENDIHGVETIKDAIANSCNIALSTMVFRLGKESLFKYLEAFGLTSRTGIDFPAETGSIIKSQYGLARVDLANMSFGQGIAISPIQYLSAVNAVVNGGYLLTPRYVSELTDDEGNTIIEYKKNIVRQVISKETSDIMRDILENAAYVGTAKRAYIAGYRVGGKTGTAEKAVNGEYNAAMLSYVGFAPMNNPQVSVLVIIDEPAIQSFASVVAAPVAKEVLENVLPYLGVEPNYSDVEREAVSTVKETVPNVIGMNYQDAKYWLEVKGFKVEIADSEEETSDFEIIAQYPLGDQSAPEGSTVYVYRG